MYTCHRKCLVNYQGCGRGLFLFAAFLNWVDMANAIRKVPDQVEFRSLMLFKIGVRFYNRIRETVDWCRQYGLLAITMQCPNCADRNCIGVYARPIDEVCWRCPDCRKVISIRKGKLLPSLIIGPLTVALQEGSHKNKL